MSDATDMIREPLQRWLTGRIPGAEKVRVADFENAGFARRDVGDTFYYELFAGVRYAAIVVRVMNRLVDRGDLGADQRLWLQNPASTCLDQLLESI